VTAVVQTPWTGHRDRAAALRERHPFAAEMLSLYLALLDVWEAGWEQARAERPAPGEVAGWATGQVLPQVVKATEAAGPEPLVAAIRDVTGLEDACAAWLAGAQLPPVERYLARASLTPVLVALDADAGPACAEDPAPRDDRHCPRCGGPPQLSFRGDAGDQLVTGRRYLVCARCAHPWAYSGSACPSCGETSGGHRTVYAERRAGPVIGRDPDSEDTAVFPHLRVDACTACERYLIDVDVGRDPRSVPEVDELAAVPLDLYAAERGLSKITPNLLGL
jgi:FdhE protein